MLTQALTFLTVLSLTALVIAPQVATGETSVFSVPQW